MNSPLEVVRNKKAVEETLSITNATKGALRNVTRSVPFVEIKNIILGKKYELSLVFISKKKSHELNYIYRGKDKPTNVLSFSLDTKTGEIFITPSVTEKSEIGFLFIHGCLHLKGMEHGSTMEELEEKFRKRFHV